MNTIMLSVQADTPQEAVEACRRLCHQSGVSYLDTVKVDPIQVAKPDAFSDVLGDDYQTIGWRVTFTVYEASRYWVTTAADTLEHEHGLITEVPA